MNSFEGYTIQTFDDQNKRGDKSLTDTFLYDPKRVKDLNDKGAAICFVPNPQINTSRHSISNTAALKFISLDLDAAKEEDGLSNDEVARRKSILLGKIKSLIIQPNYLIETKHGFQPLWELAVSTLLATKDSRQQANEHYKAIVRGIFDSTGLKSEGDFICRILRLPGTNHMKDTNDPFLITLTELNTNKATLEGLEKVYPPVKTKTYSPLQKRQFNTDPVIQQIINYPVQEALKILSGREEVDYERFDFMPNTNGSIQLVVNGIRKGQWIDPRNNTIGGSGQGQGNPTIIQFVQWYGFNRRGEDKKTTRSKAIRVLKYILAISDDRKKHIYKKNVNDNVNKDGGCKQKVKFELTPHLLQVTEKLRKCTYMTPRTELTSLLEELGWGIYPRHSLNIAQKWNPRAILWVIDEMIKTHTSGRKIIYNSGGIFTDILKHKKMRRDR